MVKNYVEEKIRNARNRLPVSKNYIDEKFDKQFNEKFEQVQKDIDELYYRHERPETTNNYKVRSVYRHYNINRAIKSKIFLFITVLLLYMFLNRFFPYALSNFFDTIDRILTSLLDTIFKR